MTRPISGKITAFARRCQTHFALRRASLLAVQVLVLLAAAPFGIAAGELFDRGAEAFLYNRPREAASLLERAIADEPTNGRAYLYLAFSYEQLAMYERAITTLRRAESIPGIDRARVYFNIGNNFLKLGDETNAENAYSESIELSPLEVEPYLNRANVRVMREEYPPAIEDYTAVLELEPRHAQRTEIEQMIALLSDHLEQEQIRQQEEARRLQLEEEQRAAEEAARLAEEQRQREEAEARRRALLSSVLDSLDSATDDTTNMSAGNEEIDDYTDEEFDIAD